METAGDRQLGPRWSSRPRISASARGVEVVEHVLLVVAHAGPVPLLALLAAAAQAGDRVDAAGLDPGQDRWIVLGGHGRAKAPVSEEDSWGRSGPSDRLHYQHAHGRAVGRAVADLRTAHRRYADCARGGRPLGGLTGAGVIAQDRAR